MPTGHLGRRLRVAVIGTGHIARAGHLPALRELEAAGELELVGAADVDLAAARSFAAEAGIPACFDDPARLLAATAPDLVVICSPPGAHRDQAVAALRAGAWVWCEKPPCPSLADYAAIESAEREGGPYAAFVFQQRFGSGARHVRKLIREQALGQPVAALCQTTWYRDAGYYAAPWRGRWATEGGGTTMVHGIHQLDLLLDLLGPWEQVQAMAARTVPGPETETVSTALIRFASGALATAVNSAASVDEVSRVRIDCERASVELTHLYGYRNADWRITPVPTAAQEEVETWRDFGPDVPSSHTAQLRELVADMRAGRRPRCSGADGRAVLELITALYKSAFTGKPVQAGEIVPADPFYQAPHGDAEPWSAALRMTHVHGERVSVAVGREGGELFSYVYRPEAAWEAPKPYLHPIRTLSGRTVTGYRPHDHRWHKGLQMTASRLSGQNLWGGGTYVRDEGYLGLPELVGSMEHVGFGELEASANGRAVIEEDLVWRPHGGAHWADERRRIEVRDVDRGGGSWALTWSSEITNRRAEPLILGSPATEGLAGSGYTGLFWRGPRAFRGGRILTPDLDGKGPELMGCAAPWLAFMGEHDAVDGYATLVFQHDVAATRWFVRDEPYAAVAASFAFDEELVLPPGESLRLRYRIIVADGAWEREQIDHYLEAHPW